MQVVKRALAEAGFVAHAEKGHWDAGHTANWLVFTLDLQKGCVSVALHVNRIDHLRERLGCIISSKYIQARQLGSIMGTIVSKSLGVGPLCHLMIRARRIVWPGMTYYQ